MKLFASDYDGTLFFGRDQGIKEEDLEMIHLFKDNGGTFGIVSGRPLSALIHEVELYNIPFDFLIGINGGVGIDKDKNEVFSSRIDSLTAKNVHEYFESIEPISFGAHDGYRTAKKSYEEEPNATMVQEMTSFEALYEKGASGFFSHHRSVEIARNIAQEMNSKFPGILAHQNEDYVDVTCDGIDKSVGLEMMLNHLNYRDKVWVIGDAQNDQAMIEEYDSFALEHGDRKLKASASYVVESVADALKIVMDL